MKRLLFLFFNLVMFFSCKSFDLENKNVIFSMIYDYDNSPVSQTKFYLDDKYIGESDINGRFVFTVFDSGKHFLRLEKDGYEVISDTFAYEPMLVLYYKTGSKEQFFACAEKLLDEGKISEALLYIDRALSIDSDYSEALFFKAICFYKQNNFKSADEILSKIKLEDNSALYVQKFKEKFYEDQK